MKSMTYKTFCDIVTCTKMGIKSASKHPPLILYSMAKSPNPSAITNRIDLSSIDCGLKRATAHPAIILYT